MAHHPFVLTCSQSMADQLSELPFCTNPQSLRRTCVTAIIARTEYSSSFVSFPGVVRLAKAHICPRVSLGNPDDIRMGYSLAVSIPAGVKVVSKIFLYSSVKRESVLGSDNCCFQASLRLHFYFISNSTL